MSAREAKARTFTPGRVWELVCVRGNPKAPLAGAHVRFTRPVKSRNGLLSSRRLRRFIASGVVVIARKPRFHAEAQG